MGFVAASDAEYGLVASLLLAMNEEAGYHVREVRTANGGFFVPDAVSDQFRADPRVMPAVTPSGQVKTPPPGWTDPLPEPEVEYDAAEGKYFLADAAGEDPVISDEPEPDRETIRAWAKANGLDVADVGRLKTSVIEAYNAAQVE